MRRWPLFLLLAAVGGCSLFESEQEGAALPTDMARRADGKTATAWPAPLSREEAQRRIVRLIPSYARDRDGWAGDLHAALDHLGVPHATQTYCAVIAVIEQESSFQADPSVPGLARIVRRELAEREARYRIPGVVVDAALSRTSPDGRSYEQRIAALRTESQVNTLVEDMIGELPFGKTLFGGFNPIRTGGPMQVSIAFAEKQARDYPYPVAHSIRQEVFTRRGGLYFGSAHLLGYPVDYTQSLYRFADFNAGWYASRNAAFQNAVSLASGIPLTLDGDLTIPGSYKLGSTERAVRALRTQLDLSDNAIRRQLEKSDSLDFNETDVYQRVYALAERQQGKPLPRAMLPGITLQSPKITRNLTTAWFAKRVDDRRQRCMSRAKTLPKP